MKPVKFPEANFTLTAPEGDEASVEDLPVHRYEGGVISCWSVSWVELFKMALRRKLYLHVSGSTHPPLCLVVDAFEAGGANND